MHLMTYKTDSDGRTIKWCESCGFNQNSVPEKIKSQEITNKSQHITLEKDWWHYDLYLKKMLKQHTNVRFCRFWIFTLSMPISHLYILPPSFENVRKFQGGVEWDIGVKRVKLFHPIVLFIHPIKRVNQKGSFFFVSINNFLVNVTTGFCTCRVLTCQIHNDFRRKSYRALIWS